MRAVKRVQRGFTLIELVVGILAFVVALAIVTDFVAPLAKKSTEQLAQLKAAKLGSSVMNEILLLSYDENSDRSPPFLRCDEKAQGCSAVLGPEEADPTLYNDVDDYNGYTVNDVGGDYPGYQIAVTVVLDGDYSQPTVDNLQLAKRIDLAVTTPEQEVYRFQAYRGNY
ncbi:type IV pilus modification PilV family protein [Pseudoalteromonas sp. SSDWG2]|uniref:type IV pilus modification PilV family protein n=1 Tax=Pseudoalteromonas sp. SSDWG2 TaxID=3139391 RepID=UPI003BA8BF0D